MLMSEVSRICVGGVILYEIILRVLKVQYTKLTYFIFRVLEVAVYIALLFSIRKYGNSNNDCVFVVLIYCGIFLSFMYPQKYECIFNRFRFLNNIMYPVYLNHLLFITIVRRTTIIDSFIQGNKFLGIGLFLFALCIYSTVTKKFLEILNTLFTHLSKFMFEKKKETS